MRRAVGVLAGVFLACGGPSVPVSRCGSPLWDSDDAVGHDIAESAIVRVYQDRFPDTCARLGFFSVEIRTGDKNTSWFDPGNGIQVSGLTYCDRRFMQIADKLGHLDWHASAYAHEAMHIILCEDPRSWDHSDWSELGLWDLVDAARANIPHAAAEVSQ